MAENEKKVPFFKKFVGRFLLVALVPAIVLEVTITLYAASQMKSNMKDTGLEGLTELATSVLSSAQKNGFTIKDDKFVDSNGVAVAENYFDSFVDGTASHITIFSGDTRIVTTIIQDGKRVIGTKAAEKVIEVCLKGGNKYETKSVSVVGQDFMACYLPFKDNTGKTVGMVFAGKPTATIKKETTNSANKLVIVGTLVLLAAIADIVYFARSMSKRMVEAEASCRELAQGNLGIELSEALLKRSDEIGSIGRTVKLLSDSLKEIVGNIKNSSDELGMTSKTLGEMSSAIDGTSTEINETVEVITQGAISQTEEIDAASRSVNDIGEEITNISESILLLDEAAQEMSKAGRESNVIVQELRESNDHTTESINKIEEQINATNESAEKIRFAVEAISSIASQTNLLSLNASIEAARAGEAGRGFAVVATEIQKLADQSAQSASEIERIVKTLYEDSERSVETMKEAKVILTEQEEKLDKTTKQFGLINDGIKKSNEETEKIKQQITVCNESKNQIIDAMRKLNGISQDNSASMEETAASMEELNTNINILSNEALKIGSMSQNLADNIAVFKF